MKYNIHDILKIDSDLEIFPKSFEADFDEPDMIIKQRRIEIDKKEYKRFSLKFWGKSNDLYFESFFYGSTLNKILIKDFKELYYLKNSNRYNIGAIAHLLFQINLLKKGCSIIHAGAVKKDGKGYLITAIPEGGKSSTTLKMGLDEGAEILGDDSVIISEKGLAYSCPTKVRIYSGSEIINKLNFPPKKRLESKLRYLISKLPPLHRIIDANMTIDPSYFKTANQTKIDKIIVLPENGRNDNEFLINSLLSSTLSMFNYDFPNRIFQIYCFINGIDPTFFFCKTKEIITKAINTIK